MTINDVNQYVRKKETVKYQMKKINMPSKTAPGV